MGKVDHVSNFTGGFAEFTRFVDTSASDFKQIALGFLALSAVQVLGPPIRFCADEIRKVISKWFHNRPRPMAGQLRRRNPAQTPDHAHRLHMDAVLEFRK
jgi:hypothetical protein